MILDSGGAEFWKPKREVGLDGQVEGGCLFVAASDIRT